MGYKVLEEADKSIITDDFEELTPFATLTQDDARIQLVDLGDGVAVLMKNIHTGYYTRFSWGIWDAYFAVNAWIESQGGFDALELTFKDTVCLDPLHEGEDNYESDSRKDEDLIS